MTEMSKRRNGGIPASALGQPSESQIKQTAMSSARSSITRGEMVQIPIYGEVWMRVLGTATIEEIEIATWRHFEAAGLPPLTIHAGTYNLHRFRRIMAAAVRNPKNKDEPFGTLEDWADEPEESLVVCAVIYRDLKDRIDPVSRPELDAEQAREILDGFKKKDFQQLRSSGAGLLASWLISGAVQLSSSPTQSSRSSDTSQE